MSFEEKNNLCSIIVSSCDAYSDAWHPFFTLFFRYWVDCPFQVYLISGKKGYEDVRVKNVLLEDKGWANNMFEMFKEIKSPYILYLQEDYFLQSKVVTENVSELVEKMERWGAGYLRLMSSPRPDVVFDANPILGIINPHSPYRVSLQASIWKVETLKKLLCPGESGWSMEKYGSERSSVLPELFLSTFRPILDYYTPTAIKKGKWMPGALWLCKKEGIVVDMSMRPVYTWRKVVWGRIRNHLSTIFHSCMS